MSCNAPHNASHEAELKYIIMQLFTEHTSRKYNA